MKKLTLLFIALAFVACKKKEETVKTEVKEEVKTETVSKEKEWVMLFDGTSMDQWRGYGVDTMHSEEYYFKKQIHQF